MVGGRLPRYARNDVYGARNDMYGACNDVYGARNDVLGLSMTEVIFSGSRR